MPPITITLPHNLGAAGAKARIETGFADMRQQFEALGVKDVEQGWDGNTLKFTARGMGQTIGGRMIAHDKDVQIEIDLPMLLQGLAARVRQGLEKRGRAMLEPPKN